MLSYDDRKGCISVPMRVYSLAVGTVYLDWSVGYDTECMLLDTQLYPPFASEIISENMITTIDYRIQFLTS